MIVESDHERPHVPVVSSSIGCCCRRSSVCGTIELHQQWWPNDTSTIQRSLKVCWSPNFQLGSQISVFHQAGPRSYVLSLLTMYAILFVVSNVGCRSSA